MREIPALEDLLGNVVAVVSSYKFFGQPSLLKECLFGAVEDSFFLEVAKRATPEVVEVARVPALKKRSYIKLEI